MNFLGLKPKRRVIFLLCIILIVFTLCACGNKADYGESLTRGLSQSSGVQSYDFTRGDIVLPEEYSKYALASGDFAFSLLSGIKSEDENTVISPSSVLSVLSMLSNGASKKTLSQFKNVLGDGLDVSHINTYNHYLNSRLTAFNSEDGSFDTADSVWFADSFDVRTTFLQSCVDYYGSDIFRVDFSDGDVASKINKWISDRTDGEIDRLIDELPEETLGLLVNASLFEDRWLNEYDESAVPHGTFHGTKGDTTVSFMESFESYLETDYAKGISKSFKSTPCKFVAFVPADDTPLDEFIENLTFSRFDELIKSEKPLTACKCFLPKFEVRSSLSLRNSLVNMGLVDAFDAENANFSGISNTGNVYIDDVIHEAFIEVGPQGARAGAATANVIKNADAMPPQYELTFDRPFVFAIYDNESNIPLFLGIVNNC